MAKFYKCSLGLRHARNKTQYAAFKLRAVPVNINYRYLDDELLYLVDNSDAEIIVFHMGLGERVARVMDRAPNVKLWVEVDAGGDAVPGAVAYESLVDAIRRAANGKPDYGWARKVVEEASA